MNGGGAAGTAVLHGSHSSCVIINPLIQEDETKATGTSHLRSLS